MIEFIFGMLVAAITALIYIYKLDEKLYNDYQNSLNKLKKETLVMCNKYYDDHIDMLDKWYKEIKENGRCIMCGSSWKDKLK